MSLPTVVKTWTVTANNRCVFTTLNGVGSVFLFGLKTFLVGTMGYTLKYSCDGTTGPTSSSDHTDRWASAANCTTQGASTAAAQSFIVLTDGNGCDLLITYQGPTFDNVKFAFSPLGLYVPAGTANQQPTATDEVIVVGAGSSMLGITNSTDRVWHAQATTDKKAFRVAIYKAGAMTFTFGLELVTKEPAMLSNVVWNPNVVGWGTFNASPLTAAGAALGPSAGAVGSSGFARINSTVAGVGGSGETMNGSTYFSVANPELQAAAPIVPVGFASVTAGVAGKLGMRIDTWTTFCSGIAQGDTFGALGFVYFGTLVWPWNGSSTPVIS